MDIRDAFDVLLNDLRQALKNAQDAGTRAFREGRYDDAQAAAQRAEEIADELQRLESLRRRWRALTQSAKAPAKKGDRLPRGAKMSQEEFYLPILATLEEMGGQGRVQEVLDKVETMVRDRLRDVDWQILSDGRSIRWRDTAQWARHEMVQSGLLASDSPRGIWEITEAGQAYLQEHCDGI
ncbi:hypothetical protein D6833_02360 [Candidatus Parcubacteria bacterium]|nr:MAG: hypothetical protein D6833_02360 [Candidatus Parcubacteria bacterium]